MKSDLVSNPDDRTWQPFSVEGATGFHFQFSLIGKEYTDAYSIDLVRVDPGGKSETHVDPDNHAFYFIEGEGEVCIANQRIAAKPGVVIKIPVGVAHSVANTGAEPLRFLTIYDPPRDRSKLKAQAGL
jgi:quercetin dioxygenase-like cupin family protein